MVKTKAKPDPHADIKREREESSRLRGSYEQRTAAEEKLAADKEAAFQRAFNALGAEKTEIERAERILRKDFHSQQRTVADLRSTRAELSKAKRSNVEVAHAAIERLRVSAARELAGWLPRLRTLDDPTLPGAEVTTLFLLDTDDRFAEWLKAKASESDLFDGRDTATITAELAEATDRLREAEAELEKRDQLCIAARTALTACDRGNQPAVEAYLKSIKGMF